MLFSLTTMSLRVEDVPRAVIFLLVVYDFSCWHIFFVFGFLSWWLEHPQYFFEKCSALCNERPRGLPQQRYGLRMQLKLLKVAGVAI